MSCFGISKRLITFALPACAAVAFLVSTVGGAPPSKIAAKPADPVAKSVGLAKLDAAGELAPIGVTPIIPPRLEGNGGDDFGVRTDCNGNTTDDIIDARVFWDNGVIAGNTYNTAQRGGA